MHKRISSRWHDILAALFAWGILKGFQALFTSVEPVATFLKATGEEFANHYDIYSVAISIMAPILLRLLQRARMIYRQGKNAEAIGLFYCNMQADQDSRGKSRQLLMDKGAASTDIAIVGATGLNTFAEENSPLYKAVQHCQGTVKIILAYPFGDGVTRRANQLRDMSLGKYRKEIHDALRYLRDGRFAAASIQIKMYQEAPFWKAIFVSDCVWVQQYPPDDHVADAPCFAYSKQPDGSGLFMHHYRRWVRMWNSKRLGTVDLEAGTVSFNYQRADPTTLPLWEPPPDQED